MKLHYLGICLSFVFFCGVAPVTSAQEDPEKAAAGVTAPVINKAPDDALKRGTPRGSIVGFLEACSSFDFDKAAQFLDLSDLPDSVSEVGGRELARQFNHVLSRSVWFDDYSVSDNPEGIKGDDLPPFRDELVVIKDPDGQNVPLWMQRVPREDGELIWKVSNRSIALVPDLYSQFSYPPLVEKIRVLFPEDSAVLGLEMFKWFILVTVALLMWPVLYLLGRALTALITSPGHGNYMVVRKVLTGPLVAILIIFIADFLLKRLGAGAYAQQVMETRTPATLVVIWALWSVINLYRQHQQTRLTALERPGAAKLMRPVSAFLKMLVLIFGVLFWLNNIGVNITTVLAGLGVGGLAIALALQKPLEDMMGALTIFSQATIRVGDMCKYGAFTGTVEDIGLRSVKIRTLTDTLLSVPNSRIAYIEVENISARGKIRFWPTLRLRYDVTKDQLNTIMDGIRTLLHQHERVHDEPIRVRLTDFAEDAILIKVHCFLNTTDYPESLEIGEELNMGILSIVHSAGASFALPGRSVYTETAAPSA